VPCQKTLHDSPPPDACAKDIMREEIMGRHHLFLVAARMGCVMLFRGSYRLVAVLPRYEIRVSSWECFATSLLGRCT
jgi:hypothetical protein